MLKTKIVNIKSGENNLGILISEFVMSERLSFSDSVISMCLKSSVDIDNVSIGEAKGFLSNFFQTGQGNQTNINNETGINLLIGLIRQAYTNSKQEERLKLVEVLLKKCAIVNINSVQMNPIQLNLHSLDLPDSLINDLATLFKVCWEVLKLNFNFLEKMGANPLTLDTKKNASE